MGGGSTVQYTLLICIGMTLLHYSIAILSQSYSLSLAFVLP